MDISELLSQPHEMNPGCAAPYLEGFAAHMASMGHTSMTISFYLGSAIHFGGWLEAKGLDLAEINERRSRLSGHTAASVLGAATKNTFRERIRRVFSASPVF